MRNPDGRELSKHGLQNTPPLRGSRRSRAFGEADAVGGQPDQRGRVYCEREKNGSQFLTSRSKEFLLLQSEFSPHRFACGLAPLPHRLPLKGGVVLEIALFSSLPQSLILQSELTLKGGVIRTCLLVIPECSNPGSSDFSSRFRISSLLSRK